MKLRLVLLVVIALVSVGGLFACQSPSRQSGVLAEVGGISITVDDLLKHPAAYQALDNLVNDTLIMLECRERGVVLDAVEYQKNIDSFVMERGGKEEVEKFLEQNNIGWPQLFQYQRVQILTKNLVESIAGEPTENEITAYFVENEERLRNTVSSRLGIGKDEVTLDDAREDIIRDVKNKKTGDIWQTLNADLKDKYEVKNYLTGDGLKPEEEDEGLAGKLDLSGEEKKEPEESPGH